MRKLDDTDFARLTNLLRDTPELAAGYCFGSQTDPTCRNPRDLDLAVLAAQPLGLRRLLDLGDFRKMIESAFHLCLTRYSASSVASTVRQLRHRQS